MTFSDYESIDTDDQASPGIFHACLIEYIPSSMEEFSSPSTMGVSSQGSGEESYISQQYVSRSRWHVRRGRRSCRRVTVRARSSRGGRGRRHVSTRPSRRWQGERPINSGRSGSTTHLSAASLAVLNEIGSTVWKTTIIYD